MREFVVTVLLNNQKRRLFILNPMEGLFKVYWDALYLGTIEPSANGIWGVSWDTDAPILRGCCQEIGEYIESCLE